MACNATVDDLLRSVALDVSVDRETMESLLHEHPDVEQMMSLVSADDVQIVRAAVLYIGLSGSAAECPVLALCLRHGDLGVAQLAEHGLWRIWMQSGTVRGNRLLAAAIRSIKKADYEAALRLLTGLAAEEPSFAEAHFQRGIALCFLEQSVEAGQAFRDALRLNPYHFAAAAALGHTCVELGNMAGALHYYRRALAIHPRLEDLPQAVRQLAARIEPAAAREPEWS